MKKVTVIVPVYNSEKYIGRCLESILNQTYQNFDILVVNDGSTDKSQEIINQYKDKYPDKIIFIEQENKGVAKTRNESIEKASGDYIMFVDNDDYLDKNYIETYIEEIEKNDYDVVVGGFKRPNENGKIIKQLKLQDKQWCKFMIMTPWAKIYKKQYLIDNNIKFLETNLGEDNYFNLKAFLMTKKILTLEYVGYNWFFNTQSISNTKQRNIKQIELYKLLNSIYDMVKNEDILEENYQIIETVLTKYIIWIISYSTKGLTYKELSKEYDKVFKWLGERFPDYKKNKMISFTKPDGETFGSRFMTKTFMIFHNLNLGKLLTFLYSRL